MAGAQDLTPTFIADFVGQIYEAALDGARWGAILDILDKTYPDSRITLFGHRHGRPSETFTHYRNFADDDLSAYIAYYVQNSPIVKRSKQMIVGRPIYSENLISDEELFKTEHYNDFVRPRGLGRYATGVVLERSPAGMTAMALADHRNDEERRAHQIRLMQLLSPHLQRGIQLHRVVSGERSQALATKAAFDRWSHSAFVLDSTGRLVTMNAAARALVASTSDIYLGRGDVVRSFDDATTRALETAIAKCAGIASRLDTEGGEDAAAVLVPRRDGSAPLHAAAWPVAYLDEHADLGGRRASVLLIVFDPQREQRAPVRWLAQRFGLSPAEERLAEAIVGGVALGDAAEQLGIRLSTARWRLKLILQKTGCERQVNLVRLALSAPSLKRD